MIVQTLVTLKIISRKHKPHLVEFHGPIFLAQTK
jgi:hypothetical protein